MPFWLYNAGIRLFAFLLEIAAFFHPKAAKWVHGRRNWRAEYTAKLQSIPDRQQQKTLWMHVSSLGEFEQGRPVLEKLKAQHPEIVIVLSFFSPSGYNIRKNYPGADFVCYLPADTPENAADFLKIIRPDLAIFVKYDFWANYLNALRERKIPLLLISSIFRPGQPFFRWYGSFWRRMLTCFDEIQVQDGESLKLLQGIHIQSVVLAGDTRVDRVLDLAAGAKDDEKTKAFIGDAHPVLIAGSIWEADEAVLLPALSGTAFAGGKIVLAPHDPSESYVERLCRQWPDSVRYSRFDAGADAGKRTLIIDNIGLLNQLYRLGDIAYIGGGFGKGIHNTLEPAAFGLPVMFGPKYRKFEEARQFVALGGAFPVKDAASVEQVLLRLQEPAFRQNASNALKKYLQASQGASGRALQWVKRWI